MNNTIFSPRALKEYINWQTEDNKTLKKINKRMFFIAGAFILTAVFIFFAYYQNNHIVVTDVNISAHIETPFNIIHLSDLHGKQFGKGSRRLYDVIKEQSPDLIVITGDIIDKNAKNIEETAEFIESLSGEWPLACILGNNEGYTGRRDEIAGKLIEKGIILLANETAAFDINGNKVNILGLEEEAGESLRASGGLLGRLSETGGFNIVLSHYPEHYALIGGDSYKNYKFDLMLSGHAHGGQFILPFIGGVAAPGQGLFPKYYTGLYEEEPFCNKMIVSRGLGNSLFPLRLFNFPEVVNIHISYS
ncbi:MAG: metallophosphoesterase [Oscillospiraceae bacterium]|nr:metallophosphoesterase [Oscillospiraceae bacterium]